MVQEVETAASQILSNLRQTDFRRLSLQVQELLRSLQGQADRLDTNRLTDRLAAAADSVEGFMASSNLNLAVMRVEEAAGGVHALSTNVNAHLPGLTDQIDGLLAEGQTTLASLDETAGDLRAFLQLRNELGAQTRELMTQITRTARTIERFSGFLERHPNALLTGRKMAP
jgi:hypothetical protein